MTKNFFELKARHARSNKPNNKIVSLDRNTIFSSTNNKISFRHLHDIYDTKFIPMMWGEGEIVTKDDGKKVLRMHGIKHVKFYQAWDMTTPDSNIGKRQIFTMPSDAFLHAINLYDKLIKETIEDNKHEVDHLDYVYKPTCILRTYKKDTEFPSMFVCENIESVMKKNSQFDVECFLELEISNEGNNGMETDYEGYSELPKEGERMLMRVNLSAVRYETLNVNRYLSEHHIPAPLVNNPDFPGYRFDKDISNARGLSLARRQNKQFFPISFDFLASDKNSTVFDLDNGNYGIFMPNIKHVIAYQTWEYSLPDGNREKRAVKDIAVGHFLSMVKSVHDQHRQLGVSPNRGDFQPTTTIELVDEKGNRSIHLGVIRSFSQNISAMRNGEIVFAEPSEEGLYLEISTAQMFDANSNHGISGLKEGQYEVHLNIDSWWKELLCQLGIGIGIVLVLVAMPAVGAYLIEADAAAIGTDVAADAATDATEEAVEQEAGDEIATRSLRQSIARFTGNALMAPRLALDTVLGGVLGLVGNGVMAVSSTVGATEAVESAAETLGTILGYIDSVVGNVSTLGFQYGSEVFADSLISNLGLDGVTLTTSESGLVTYEVKNVDTLEEYLQTRYATINGVTLSRAKAVEAAKELDSVNESLLGTADIDAILENEALLVSSQRVIADNQRELLVLANRITGNPQEFAGLLVENNFAEMTQDLQGILSEEPEDLGEEAEEGQKAAEEIPSPPKSEGIRFSDTNEVVTFNTDEPSNEVLKKLAEGYKSVDESSETSLESFRKQRIPEEFLDSLRNDPQLQSFFSTPEGEEVRYGDVKLRYDNSSFGLITGNNSEGISVFFDPEVDGFLEDTGSYLLGNMEKLKNVEDKLSVLKQNLKPYANGIKELEQYDVFSFKGGSITSKQSSTYKLSKDAQLFVDNYNADTEIPTLTEKQKDLLDTYLTSPEGDEINYKDYTNPKNEKPPKASNEKTWFDLDEETQQEIDDAVNIKSQQLLKKFGFLDRFSDNDSLPSLAENYSMYRSEQKVIGEELFGNSGVIKDIKGYVKNKYFNSLVEGNSFGDFQDIQDALLSLPEPETISKGDEIIAKLEKLRDTIKTQKVVVPKDMEFSNASRIAKIENTINSLKYSSSVSKFLVKLFGVLQKTIITLKPEIKAINSEYEELKKKPEVTEAEKNEFNDKIGALNIKVQKVMKYVKLYYSMVVTIRSVRISNELGAILTYSVWTDLTTKIQNVSDKNSVATSKHAYYVYDLCESNNKNVFTNFQSNFKGILGENSFIRTPNQFEGAKRISIWDFKERNNINPGLHKLLLDSVGVTEGELLFLDRISTQEENVGKYVALLEESYTKKNNNQAIYNFCKTTKLIPPHDLYTENPKEVEFCAGIRGHLVGSDATSNSVVAKSLIYGKLCRFQLPIYKDYYETWKGMHALYKSYKNSNYSQQIKASLLLVNKVLLILESLGEGVKTSKLILEKGSKDELYFANNEQENGIIYYGEDKEFLSVNPFLIELEKDFEDKNIVIKSPSESKFAVYHLYLNHIKYLAVHLGKNTWQKNSSKSIIADKTKVVEEFIEYMAKNPVSLETNSALAVARFMIFFSGLLLDMYRSVSNNFNNGKDFANWIADQSNISNKDLEKKSKPATECQKAVSKFYQVSTKAFTVFYQIVLKDLYKRGLINAKKYSPSKN